MGHGLPQVQKYKRLHVGRALRGAAELDSGHRGEGGAVLPTPTCTRECGVFSGRGCGPVSPQPAGAACSLGTEGGDRAPWAPAGPQEAAPSHARSPRGSCEMEPWDSCLARSVSAQASEVLSKRRCTGVPSAHTDTLHPHGCHMWREEPRCPGGVGETRDPRYCWQECGRWRLLGNRWQLPQGLNAGLHPTLQFHSVCPREMSTRPHKLWTPMLTEAAATIAKRWKPKSVDRGITERGLATQRASFSSERKRLRRAPQGG